MRTIYMIVADVLKALGWEVEINEKENYWSLVLTNTNSSEDMPESHKSCLRGLLRGWLMEFNYECGHQQVNIYKELHGLNPEDNRYSCLDTCANRTDGNTPQYELNDREIFVRRNDRFDRYVLTEPIADPNVKTDIAALPDLDKPHKKPWKDRTLERLISWMIHSATFCFLFAVAGLELPEREIIAYSLMLGLVAGSINNIEWVLRELFEKKED